MTDVWSGRAQSYQSAVEQREGEDLDLIVTWCEGCETVLDVATGGGHVARRLRAAGQDVITCDPAPGMHPDVICRAEDLPFAEARSTPSSRASRRTTSPTSTRRSPRWRAFAEPRDRRGHALHERGRRDCRAPPRPDPRALVPRGRVAVVPRARRAGRRGGGARREDPPLRRMACAHRLRRRRGGARPRAARAADLGGRRLWTDTKILLRARKAAG